MFIHYGSDHFNPYFFAPVQNSEWVPNSVAFREPLPTWDCDCVFVMNKDVVEEVP